MSVVALYYDIVCLHACGCGPEHEGGRVCTQALYISVLFLLTHGCDSEAKNHCALYYSFIQVHSSFDSSAERWTVEV